MSILNLLRSSPRSLLPRYRIPREQFPGSSLNANSQQGITIIEVLIALSIIAITGALIAPPLILATATRVQNQKAEQAYQVAQGEVDRIRVLVETGRHTPERLSAVPNGYNNDSDLSAFGSPTGTSGLLRSSAACNTYEGQQIAANEVLEVDVTGDCDADFVLQSYRTPGRISALEQTADGQLRPTYFEVMVRVYVVLGEDADSIEWDELGTEQASLTMTSPACPPEDPNCPTQERRPRYTDGFPLAILNSQMNWSNNSDALCEFHGGCD